MAAEIDFTYVFNNTIILLLLQAKDADFRRFTRIFSCLLKFFPRDAVSTHRLEKAQEKTGPPFLERAADWGALRSTARQATSQMAASSRRFPSGRTNSRAFSAPGCPFAAEGLCRGIFEKTNGEPQIFSNCGQNNFSLFSCFFMYVFVFQKENLIFCKKAVDIFGFNCYNKQVVRNDTKPVGV